MGFEFEPMSEAHAEAVMNIFNYYIENSFAAYPERKLPMKFMNNLLEMTRGYPAFVIKNQDQVLGFCFLRAYHPLPVFKKTAEITYFIVAEAVGKGIGRSALALLEKESQKMGISHILASISSLNEPSIRFHQKNGFVECGRFQKIGKKFGKEFDVIWMEKTIIHI